MTFLTLYVILIKEDGDFMTIGERIKLLREKNSMTQTEIANKIGIATQTIFKYEKNIVTNIPLDNIEALAKIFDVSPCYLMGWIDNPDPNSLNDIQESTITSIEKKHLLKYRALDDRGKTMVDTVLDIEYENAKAKYLEEDDLPAALTTLPPFEEIYEEQENKVFRTDRLGDDGYVRHAAFGGGVWKEKKKDD